MAFPFLFESNFEQGTNAEWDSESDADAVLDFPHYTALARVPWPDYVPYRGAYVARWRLNGGTADATLTEGDVNVSADGTFGVRFSLYIGGDFTATADDTMNFLELQGTGTAEVTVGFRVTAASGLVEIGVGETAPTAFIALERHRWYPCELFGNVDDGAGDDGDATLVVHGAGTATVTDLDQGAITDAVVGFQDHLATTTGTVLLDAIVFDTARVYPIVDRFPEQVVLTKSAHVFVGPGVIENVTLHAGAGTDCTATLFDTDRGNTRLAEKWATRLNNVTASEMVDPAGMPVALIRGAYLALGGTNPRATVKIRRAVAWGSGGAVKGYGLRTRPTPLEVL